MPPLSVTRPCMGRELQTLVGFTAKSLYVSPNYECLNPRPINLYVTLAALHRAVVPRSSAFLNLTERGLINLVDIPAPMCAPAQPP